MAYLVVHVRFSSWALGVVVWDKFLRLLGSEAMEQGASVTKEIKTFSPHIKLLLLAILAGI